MNVTYMYNDFNCITVYNQFNSIQYILLHKTTNSMFIANKEIIKSTNGEMDFPEEFAII